MMIIPRNAHMQIMYVQWTQHGIFINVAKSHCSTVSVPDSIKPSSEKHR